MFICLPLFAPAAASARSSLALRRLFHDFDFEGLISNRIAEQHKSQRNTAAHSSAWIAPREVADAFSGDCALCLLNHLVEATQQLGRSPVLIIGGPYHNGIVHQIMYHVCNALRLSFIAPSPIDFGNVLHKPSHATLFPEWVLQRLLGRASDDGTKRPVSNTSHVTHEGIEHPRVHTATIAEHIPMSPRRVVKNR